MGNTALNTGILQMAKIITLAENEPLPDDFPAFVERDDVLEINDELETELYNAQERLIQAEYGEEIAKNANYGWAVDDYGVATKVYIPNKGKMVLCSEIAKDGTVKHQWLEG
jgi:hypothetical protein